MAQENEDGQEKTEDPSDERRQEFREKGEVAHSREFTSVFVLVSSIIFVTYFAQHFTKELERLFVTQFQSLGQFQVTQKNVLSYINSVWGGFIVLILPLFALTTVIASFSTFTQTKLNFSWKRLAPNFQKFNLLKGIARMVSGQAAMELFKGVGKMTAVGIVSYLILKSEWYVTPGLINLGLVESWDYWANITRSLFWAVAGLLLLIAGADYMYNFITLENKMKMTKKEVKDEFKKREIDPHVKNRMRRMQREIVNRQMIEQTKQATVVITNPTHFAVALKYEIGMAAPIVVAKGVDFLAQRMKEAAKENDIPMVENKPLARTLYKILEVGQEIPESLYKAVSEVIRYVFKLKGVNYGSQTQTESNEVNENGTI